MNAGDMEAEALSFWRLSRGIAAIRLSPYTPVPLADTLAEMLDDMEVIVLHTDWPRLKAAAERVLVPPGLRRAAR
jgi:hypothetical protein